MSIYIFELYSGFVYVFRVMEVSFLVEFVVKGFFTFFIFGIGFVRGI